jgi:hypothetical protein
MAVMYCVRCGALTPTGRSCAECGGSTLAADEPMVTVPREYYNVHEHEWKLTEEDREWLRIQGIQPD